MAADAYGRIYKEVIKVEMTDPPERRARDIAEGISYACALLMDEYGWTADAVVHILGTADAVVHILERVQDEVQDHDL